MLHSILLTAANLRYQSSNCPICRARESTPSASFYHIMTCQILRSSALNMNTHAHHLHACSHKHTHTHTAFRALLQIQALEPLDPNKVIDEDEATGDPKVSSTIQSGCNIESQLFSVMAIILPFIFLPYMQYSIPGFKCVPLLQAVNGYQLENDTGPVAGPGETKETRSAPSLIPRLAADERGYKTRAAPSLIPRLVADECGYKTRSAPYLCIVLLCCLFMQLWSRSMVRKAWPRRRERRGRGRGLWYKTTCKYQFCCPAAVCGSLIG